MLEVRLKKMAKFINSLYTPYSSGKVGDKVYGNTRYGPFERQAPVRIKPFTPAEINTQKAFSLLSPIWSSIEDSDREQWVIKGRDRDIARKVGNKNIKAGWNLFHSINLTMLSAGQPIIMKVPNFVYPQEFKDVKIRIEKLKRKKELILETEPGIQENTILIIYGTRAMSPGIMSINPNEYKIVAIVGCNTKVLPKTNIISLTECYEKKYGRLPINGQKVSFVVRPLNRHCAMSSYPRTITFIYRDVAESAISKQ